MVLSSIGLRNFRLHKNTNLDFSKDLNYIVGGNGQGKTTVLEAIYYLCTTKNLNQNQDSEAVSFDEKHFEVKGHFRDLTENITRIHFDLETSKKTYFVDEKQTYRASSIIGKFPVVTLVQSDHAVTLGAPAERRKLVDSIISQYSETYLIYLLDYNKTLRHRSALLSKIRELNDKSLMPQLEAWTETLVKMGLEIIKHRLKFVENFNEYVCHAYNKIMEKKENPSIEYNFMGETRESEIEGKFIQELNNSREDELRRAKNLIGPHRDDFHFYINHYELRKYGSQGQHKTFQIALRFAQFFYMKDRLGRTPLFLMDDVFGELDANRAKKISMFLREIGQAFITMTDLTKVESIHIGNTDLLIEIENGRIVNA
ncbi:MAG: DNA replication and repair protein RecF [Melioribacteraceae bacterium]|nr:DNA replication and repair protein RecF [Melioribacteraceae bacterium]